MEPTTEWRAAPSGGDYSNQPCHLISERGYFRTSLGVPLLREGVPIGVLVLARPTVRPFSAKEIELVTTFANQAVIAIENVRLFDDAQARTRELTESLQQQTAIADMKMRNFLRAVKTHDAGASAGYFVSP